MIPLVVASEVGRAQTSPVAMQAGGCRTTFQYTLSEQNVLESPTIDGDSPVCEALCVLVVS